MRASMGATRGRLASLLLAESLVLAVPAAILSLPIALLMLRVIARGVPRIPTAGFDVELSAAAALVAIGAAVVCGLLPLRDVLRTDPVALAAAAVVLGVVMLGSAYIPARRASRVDPMSVLRYE